jgi:hypothetical protein
MPYTPIADTVILMFLHLFALLRKNHAQEEIPLDRQGGGGRKSRLPA